MQSRNDTTCKARPHGLISSVRKTGRMGNTLQVIVNESKAAKHKAFSRPQGGSVLHISLQVGVFKFYQDYWYQVRKSREKINIDIS